MSEQRRTPKPTPSKTDDIGHGYWDEKLLAEQIEELTSKVCLGCGKSCGVTLSGTKKSGAGRELVFMCKLCYVERPVQRGSELAKAPGKAGAAPEATEAAMKHLFNEHGDCGPRCRGRAGNANYSATQSSRPPPPPAL